MLSSLFERCMKRRGVKESDPYDWEKPSQLQPATNQTNVSNNMQATNIQTLNNDMHANITQMTVAGSNASGIEYVSVDNYLKKTNDEIEMMFWIFFIPIIHKFSEYFEGLLHA
jgi:hypothetical protein